MYMKSVQNAIPAKFGRIERPLSPKHYGAAMDASEEGYDYDVSVLQKAVEWFVTRVTVALMI